MKLWKNVLLQTGENTQHVLLFYTHFPKIQPVTFDMSETLGPPLEFKFNLCGFEQCLAAQHELVMTDATVGKKGLRG